MTENTDKNIESLDFPINEKLLEEAAQIKTERDLIKDRIEKIDERRDEVSPQVYKKVRNDYVVRFKETTDALLEKKTDIDRELSALYEARTKITEQLESHNQILEEAKFRHMLGEYDEREFKDQTSQAEKKATKFEKVLSAVNNNISRYESLFPEDDELLDDEGDMPLNLPQEGKTGNSTSPSISVTGEENPEEYLVGNDSEDYFSAGSEKTDRAVTPNTGSHQITIVEGENRGNIFNVKNNLSFGRSDANDITLKEAKVSRQHAIIKEKAGEYVILDLNSSNGVFINGQRVKEYVLTSGDQIEIGDFKLKFE